MRKPKKLPDQHEERRLIAESNLEEFIKLVTNNKRLLGNIHRDVIAWWTSSSVSSHTLLLMPRDHMKSALVAFWAAWMLTKDPTLRILYISANSNLATKQLKFIKDILTCDAYRVYWPEMVHKNEAKREKWTEREISVDHPKRREESIRDPSIFTAGLTTNIVGLHCDICILDDVVVSGNAYTEEGRQKCIEQYGYLSSIEGVNAREIAVGTRYHPNDLYSELMKLEIEKYNAIGELIERSPLFEVKQYEVETAGDGSGQYLWPRQQRSDGQWFGFDQDALNKKKSQYINKLHFRAQYYNDPHDVDSSPIQRSQFQYYEQKFLTQRDGRWFFKGQRINVTAAVDFAYTTTKRSDYSSIVVVGVDGSQNYYILDIERFKTDKISDYYLKILGLYEKWGFRKIRAEVTTAQSVIVKDLKENYIRKNGLSLAVEEFKPTRWLGAKEERINAILEPKYSNLQIWHYLGGWCQALEEELMFANPPHDDIKDALASAIDFAIPPTNFMAHYQKAASDPVIFHARWGGVS